MTTGATATAGVNFDTPPTSGTTTFRLLQSSRSWTSGPPTSQADATTDAAGATTKVTWGSSGPSALVFTIGNSALGVTNQALPLATTVVNGKDVRQVTLADGRILTVYLNRDIISTTAQFSWMVYGNWNIASSGGAVLNSAVYVAGFETPLSGKPTSGTATFNGFLEGAALAPNGSGLPVASLTGTVQLNVNWTSGAITGAASSIVAAPLPLGSQANQSWNNLSFSGTILSGATSFSGTTTVSSSPGSPFSLTTGATGPLSGQFFGTTAQEVGAIWGVHDGTRGATGYLVAKQ
ncbi:transferrin-binding protein-like solute binding protein [Sphingobium nicotianae]|uniref:Transferrin-binding protein B C-lobe/N-lobe beta-barrel domain-containing protein n=1 Tax=Sphingobium nicotianae TaxID=2782607 RepID=A0A9X1DBI6_9SPHN|nr:transferrin-binding protein-like solute binding protein [Sphingobium nicotianae]MBT2186876.1 hypothetical protein [Sphingobium nicotianae]